MRNPKSRTGVRRMAAAIETVEQRMLFTVAPISLDPSFGTGGVVNTGPYSVTANFAVFETADSVAELPNGQTLVAGQVILNTSGSTQTTGLYIAEYNPDGTQNYAFAPGGSYENHNIFDFISPPAGGSTSVISLQVDKAGNIYLGEAGAGIIRYYESGVIDKTFGVAGTASVPQIGGFTIETNGQIVVVSQNETVTRLNSNGQVDTTFGTGGTAALPSVFTEAPYVLTTQSDGGILVAGSIQETSQAVDLSVVRLTAAGAVDTTFGSNGIAIADQLPAENDNEFRYSYEAFPSTLKVLPTGTIVLAGTASTEDGPFTTQAGPTIAEFLPTGKLNASFGAGGQTPTYLAANLNLPYSNVTGFIVQADGSLVVTGTQQFGFPPSSDSSYFLLRYTAGGSVDTIFTNQIVPGDPNNFSPGNVAEAAIAGPNGTVIVSGYVEPDDTQQNYAVFARYITDAPAPVQPVTGTVIGSTGSYGGKGNVAANAFDGNINTFFDAKQASGDWTGLDLGSAKTISQIGFAPRAGWASRMVGGVFQGSNTPDFSSGVQALYTITTAPTAGQLTTEIPSVISSFRYVRYLGPAGGYCNIAEAEFLASPQPLTGTVIGTPGSYQNQGNTIANVFDGNFSTFFDAPTASGAWVGLDLGSAQAVAQVSFAPRDSGWTGFAKRMIGGEIQASNTEDFSSGVVTVYTITTAPPVEQLTTVTLPTVGAYRYWRYIGTDGSSCNIAELGFEG